ncbi:MAG TPA: MotA/TolQ/ExbB proton channel family protein [Verrucomicrobiota bacterium]|nr:biopolymer transporter ExbB [Verrucomicrobiales bacterium]HRI13216.1 MotA/TolQ/ExbB proton channel family protein [Verrucomicrobiota bacterium]
MVASLADGGPFIWVLLFLSVVALAIVLERGWSLRRSKVLPPALVEAMNTADVATLRGACTATPSVLAGLVLSVLDHLRWPKEETVSAVEVKARREVVQLERGLVLLEVIVGVAPLIGLVGTIYGIIPLFVDFGKAISGDYALLAKGIGAALNKTLAGLMVAIPSLVAWSYYNKKVEVLAVELEGQCDDLIRRQYLGGAGAPAAGSTASKP